MRSTQRAQSKAMARWAESPAIGSAKLDAEISSSSCAAVGRRWVAATPPGTNLLAVELIRAVRPGDAKHGLASELGVGRPVEDLEVFDRVRSVRVSGTSSRGDV